MVGVQPSMSRLFTLILLLIATMASCYGDWVSQEAAYPLAKIEYLSPAREVFVHAEQGVRMGSLVSLQPFVMSKMRPGISAEEASKLVGEPDFVTNERGGYDEVFGFEAQGGMIEVVRQRVESEGYEGDRWLLRFRSSGCIDLVSPIILDQLRRHLGSLPETATILGEPSEVEGVVKIVFQGDDDCSMIWWLSEGAGNGQPNRFKNQSLSREAEN